MTKNLYFIPLLSRAVENPETGRSLREALSSIRSLGTQAEYRQGYEQFLVVLAESMRRMLSMAENPLRFIVTRERGFPRTMEMMGEYGIASLKDLAHGRYQIRLHTGMLLWEGEFTREQLLWAYAFGDEALPAAAASPGLAAQPSSVIQVIPGELVLRTYPGPLAGRIEIELLEPERDEK